MRSGFLILSILAVGLAHADTPPGDKAPSKTVTAPPVGQTPVGAGAQLKPTQGQSAAGSLNFVPEKNGVRIAGLIEGLKPGAQHGFHIHEKGDCSAPDASSAGAHLNPSGKPHGEPKSNTHHLGDLLNLRADAQGVAKIDAVLEGATLRSAQPTDLLGKAVVVHEKLDDYKSQPAGNSGSRIACGVIE